MTTKTVVNNVKTVVNNVQAGIEHVQSCVDFLKTVTSIHDGAEPSKIFKDLLKLLCRYGKSIPYLGVILNFVEGRVSDDNANDVARLLQNLNQQIIGVRDEIRELENKIKWEAVKLKYGDVVTRIETGMKYLTKISRSANLEKQQWEDRLKELCTNGEMTLAVENLLKGLCGNGLLSNDILEAMYDHTKGHRRHIELMCVRFLQLFSGGLLVIATYETLVRGEEASLNMMESFEGDEGKLMNRFDDILQKCKDCFEKNMLADLNEVLEGEMSNREAADHLGKFLPEKYDWLDTYCIICNKSKYIDYDFRGDHVKSLERNVRFGVIFYRE